MGIFVDDGKGGFKELTHEEFSARIAERDARWAAAQANTATLLEGLTDDERWALRQALAGEGRYYGSGGTIHQTGHLDVEVAPDGDIVAIWFRCQPLPFKVTDADRGRAVEMRSMYGSGAPQLIGVEVLD